MYSLWSQLKTCVGPYPYIDFDFRLPRGRLFWSICLHTSLDVLLSEATIEILVREILLPAREAKYHCGFNFLLNRSRFFGLNGCAESQIRAQNMLAVE